MPFSQETAQKIFGGSVKQHLLLFIDSANTEQADAVKADVKAVAEAERGSYLFVTIDKTDSRVLEFFGVTAQVCCSHLYRFFARRLLFD